MDISLQEVAVVILNWNGEKYLRQFLPGVIANSGDARIYVADNGSTDDSLDYVSHLDHVKPIKIPRNEGFCRGYNLALAQIEATYYVLLNSDVEVTRDWLVPLFQYMEQHPRTGACQPILLDLNNREAFEYAGAAGGYLDMFGFPFCRGRIFQTIEKYHQQYQTAEVFWASGACMFVRATVYHQLGGLDERLFAHMEEIDLCWRMQQAGYSVACVTESQVYHLGGGTLHKSNPHKTFLNFRNSLYILHKNTRSPWLLLILFARLCLDGLAGIYFLAYGHYEDTFAVLKAHFEYYRLVPEIIRKRRSTRIISGVLLGMLKHSIVWNYYFLKKKYFGV